MDDTPFDDHTHEVIIPSRRGVFAAAGATMLAALATLLRPAATIRAKKKKKKGAGRSSPRPAGPQGPAGPAGPAGPVQIAYAHVNPDGTFHHAKGVVGIQTFDKVDDPQQPMHRTYCFKLDFAPNVAVGSAFINNNAVVATALGYDNTTGGYPEGYQDAKVRVYAANSSEVRNDVNFKIVFY